MPTGDKSIPKSQEQFLIDLKIKQPKLSNIIKVIGIYKNSHIPILIETKYGNCLTKPSNLLSGKFPTIQSAVNPNEYFKNQLKDKQPKLFAFIEIIDQYQDAKKHILVKTKYGICSVTPDKLLQGKQPSIKSAINKNVYFENELKNKYPKIFKSIKILSDYKTAHKHILVKTKYGDCLVEPNTLLSGSFPTIKSAINKTEYFKNELKNKYPKLFDSIEIIEEYKESQQYLLVKTKYGVCKTKPTCLLNGKIPSIVTAMNPNEYFINQAKEVHGDLYDYSLVKYVNNAVKVKIISSEGIFLQPPASHLAGHGCPLLKQKSHFYYRNYVEKGLRNKKSNSFKIYIIKCWNNNETFYKIGKTYKTIKQRFLGESSLPYNYEIIQTFEFEKTFEEGYKCCKLEHKLQIDNKEFKYIPKLKFGGRYECFSDLKEFI